MKRVWGLLFICGLIVTISSQVTKIQLVDFRSYAISILQRTMWKVEQKCWCNLKVDNMHVSLNENVLGDRIVAEIDLKNGFVVSVQKMDILEFTIQRGWIPSSLNTTMVNVRSTLRLLEVALGFDIITTMDEKTFHTTGMIVYPSLEFDFTESVRKYISTIVGKTSITKQSELIVIITKHLVTNDITVDVVGRTIRHSNFMHFFPENDVTKVFVVLFDWNSTAPSVAKWARDIIRPITLELATDEIDFPRICYDCPV